MNPINYDWVFESKEMSENEKWGRKNYVNWMSKNRLIESEYYKSNSYLIDSMREIVEREKKRLNRCKDLVEKPLDLTRLVAFQEVIHIERRPPHSRPPFYTLSLSHSFADFVHPNNDSFSWKLASKPIQLFDLTFFFEIILFITVGISSTIHFDAKLKSNFVVPGSCQQACAYFLNRSSHLSFHWRYFLSFLLTWEHFTHEMKRVAKCWNYSTTTITTTTTTTTTTITIDSITSTGRSRS